MFEKFLSAFDDSMWGR